MTRAAFGQVCDLLLALVAENGPQTQADLRQLTGKTKQQISSAIHKLTSDLERIGPRRMHISAWVWDADGERCYPRAVYAIGNKPHKPKPKADQLAVKRRYWARRRERLTAASIFRLGQPSTGLMRGR